MLKQSFSDALKGIFIGLILSIFFPISSHLSCTFP